MGNILKLIDLELAYVDEYFVQVPFVVMSTIFQAVEKQYQKDLMMAADLHDAAKKKGQKDEFKAQLAAYLANEDKPPELIVANYAERILKKIKKMAGCDEEPDLDLLLLVPAPGRGHAYVLGCAWEQQTAAAEQQLGPRQQQQLHWTRRSSGAHPRQ